MARRRIYLRTVGHILTELGHQYRAADQGRLPWQDARAAASILREMRHTLEGGDFETRLQALERQFDTVKPAPRVNGQLVGRVLRQ
jgi:hypothetical protein